ncbi:MAG: hypothetical protein AB8H79_07045 [Myxococcota bacterium]
MRFFWALALVACAGTEPTDTSPFDTDTGDSDTDVELTVQWNDRTIETSTTINAVYSGGTGAWVVGENGDTWVIAGNKATRKGTGGTDDVTGLWGTGDSELVAVGFSGTVLSLQADEWVRSADPALGTTNFEDLDGTRGSLTAVSATGIYRFNGDAWAFEDNGFNRALRAIWVQPGGDAWAVGDDGTVLRRVADVWEQVSGVPSGVDLSDVHGNGDNVYMVGNRGTMLRWLDGAFVEIETDTTINLAGVWVASTGMAYVVGSNGLALKYDPNLPVEDEDDSDAVPGGFVELPTGSDANLYAVWGSGEDNVWAVGNRGAVFRYTGPR